MKHLMLWGLVTIGFVVLLAKPAHAAEGGKITGIAIGTDDKPAAGVAVKLIRDAPFDARNPNSGPRVVAKTTTDAEGKFELKDVEPGDYRLEGGDRHIGWIYNDVTVTAGKTTDMGQIKLVKLN